MRTMLRGKFTLLFMMLGLLLAVPAIALADDIRDGLDTTAQETQTITAGDSTSTGFTNEYWIVANGAGTSPSGCDVLAAGDSITATFKVNTPSEVSASVSSLTFDECRAGSDLNSQTVKFTSNTPGTYTIPALTKTSGTGTYTTTNTDFTLVVNDNCPSGDLSGNPQDGSCAAPPPSDTTGPVITKVVTGTLGNNDWYTSNVSVDWTVVDNESAISSQSGCADFSVNSDQNTQTYTCSATSAGGTSSDSVTIKRDATPPEVTLGGTSGTSGDNGWYKSKVTQTFNASDATSGLAGPASFTRDSGANEEGQNVNIPSGDVYDNAGNTASASAGPFKIDLSDPTIEASLSPQNPASSGWYNAATGAPTVSFQCSDDVSGLAANACPGNYTFGNGDNQSHEGTVTDQAGRSATTTNVNGIKVDLDAPNAPTATTDPLNPVANSGGFFKDTVKVSYGGSTDVGPSGVKDYTAAQTFGSTGTHNYSGTATDNAGNVSNAATGQVKVDADVPTVGITGCPTSPVTLSSTQNITVAASDVGSGLVSDPSGQVSLDTSSVGSKTKTITVDDKVGHTKSATCNYSVNYGFSAFLQPINDTAHQLSTSPDVSTFKAGSTVPVKFQLTDATGKVVQSATAPQWITPAKGAATTQAVDETVYTDPATTGTTYRWDSTAQQYIYNWGTKGVAGSFYYRIGVKLDDGSTHYVNISLR